MWCVREKEEERRKKEEGRWPKEEGVRRKDEGEASVKKWGSKFLCQQS